MKKGFIKCVALLCSLTLLLTLFTAFPAISGAQEQSPSLKLRIEGPSSTVLTETSVSFTQGQSLYDILVKTLTDKNVPFSFPSGSYGHSLLTIDGITSGKFNDDFDGWMYYINDKMAASGIDGEKPADGDSIVIYYGGMNNTLYPIVTVDKQYPTVGSPVVVSVNADKTTYDANWNATTSRVSVPGFKVTFNGQAFTDSDNDGKVTLTMPAGSGSYSFKISKDTEGSYPAIVRTGEIPITVYASASDSAGAALASNLDVTAASLQPLQLAVTSLPDGSKASLIPSTHTTETVRDGTRTYRLEFQPSTVITGPSGWDGSFTPPCPLDATAVSVENSNVRMAVRIGSASANLTLNNFATLILPMQTGKQAGYLDAAGTFHAIPKLSSNNVPSSGSDGYYDDTTNNRLIIYTRHFSTFVAYVPSSSVAVTDSAIDAEISSSSSLLANSDASYWTALALSRAGRSVPASFLTNTATEISENGGDYSLPSSLAMIVIGLRAAGADPANFNGVNLVEKLWNYQNIEKSGLNGPVYALLALDSGNYSIPPTAVWNQSKLINVITGYQNPNGSFSLSKGIDPDPDMTSMALTALAPHIGETGVQNAVNSALNYLSSVQKSDGGFVAAGSSDETLESAAQVIIALSTLGIDPASDTRFVKSGKSPLDSLMSYKTADGGFAHTLGAGTFDTYATQQALMALEAYRRYERHLPVLYDLSASSPTITAVAFVTENPDTGSNGGMACITAALLLSAAYLVIFIKKSKLRQS